MLRPATSASWPGRWARLVLACAALLLLVGGTALAGLHHHGAGDAPDHCALCSLAHAHAEISPGVPVPAPLLPRQETGGFAQHLPPDGPAPPLAPARAPPGA
jgi:hypothetical protein